MSGLLWIPFRNDQELLSVINRSNYSRLVTSVRHLLVAINKYNPSVCYKLISHRHQSHTAISAPWHSEEWNLVAFNIPWLFPQHLLMSHVSLLYVWELLVDKNYYSQHGVVRRRVKSWLNRSFTIKAAATSVVLKETRDPQTTTNVFIWTGGSPSVVVQCSHPYACNLHR